MKRRKNKFVATGHTGDRPLPNPSLPDYIKNSYAFYHLSEDQKEQVIRFWEESAHPSHTEPPADCSDPKYHPAHCKCLGPTQLPETMFRTDPNIFFEEDGTLIEDEPLHTATPTRPNVAADLDGFTVNTGKSAFIILTCTECRTTVSQNFTQDDLGQLARRALAHECDPHTSHQNHPEAGK